VQYAKTMGVGDVPSVPSLALGSGEVTLQSMTAAYAAFANQGQVPTPVLIRRVVDRDGTVLYQANNVSSRAISETTAFLMSTMLADVINAGTAAGARSLGFKLPAAGKTGTTNDFNDAWFIGFTPKLVTGVWVGFDQPHTILPNGFAADIAVPFWTKFMKVATSQDKPEWLTPPSGVTTATVCRISGKLASEECNHVEVVGKDGWIETRSMVYTEYFVRGTEPTEYCDVHAATGTFGTVAGGFPDQPSRTDSTGNARTGVSVATNGTFGTATPSTTSASDASTVSDEIPPPAPEPERKRGFWSRIIGRGKDSKKN
jgi:membrane carboxypeptidase/penicillin-binding protein